MFLQRAVLEQRNLQSRYAELTHEVCQSTYGDLHRCKLYGMRACNACDVTPHLQTGVEEVADVVWVKRLFVLEHQFLQQLRQTLRVRLGYRSGGHRIRHGQKRQRVTWAEARGEIRVLGPSCVYLPVIAFTEVLGKECRKELVVLGRHHRRQKANSCISELIQLLKSRQAQSELGRRQMIFTVKMSP